MKLLEIRMVFFYLNPHNFWVHSLSFEMNILPLVKVTFK